MFFVRPFNYTGPGQAESFVIPKLVAHFAQRAETVELGNLDVEREFNDVRFVCEAYLQLLEKAVPGEVYNICSGKPVALKSVLELLSQITSHHLHVKVNPAFVRNNEIHRLCGSPAKLIGVVGDIPLPALQDTLRWMLGATGAPELTLMKVALNATALLSPLTGIGQYTYHLAKGLQALPGLELDLFYGSGWSKEVRDQPVPSIAAIKSLFKRFMPNAYSVNRFLQQNRFTRGVRSNRADIYHEPNFLAFKFNGPSVITVHDLSWIRFPQHPSGGARAGYEYLF